MNITIYIDEDGNVTITDLPEDLLELVDSLGELPLGIKEQVEAYGNTLCG